MSATTHFTASSHNGSTRLQWEHDTYSGTITIPDDCHSGPVEIEWDESDLPENWEEIEELITQNAYDHHEPRAFSFRHYSKKS